MVEPSASPIPMKPSAKGVLLCIEIASVWDGGLAMRRLGTKLYKNCNTCTRNEQIICDLWFRLWMDLGKGMPFRALERGVLGSKHPQCAIVSFLQCL